MSVVPDLNCIFQLTCWQKHTHSCAGRRHYLLTCPFPPGTSHFCIGRRNCICKHPLSPSICEREGFCWLARWIRKPCHEMSSSSTGSTAEHTKQSCSAGAAGPQEDPCPLPSWDLSKREVLQTNVGQRKVSTDWEKLNNTVAGRRNQQWLSHLSEKVIPYRKMLARLLENRSLLL